MKKAQIDIPDGVKRIHFIGIGGSGMFPLVQILSSQGYYITGSDNNESDIVNTERAMGIDVTMGQRAENIRGADMIVYSAAIMDTNPELIAARESGLPLWERARLLGAVSARYGRSVGVCGTHGKTTVTSLLVHILYSAGFDPSAVIGGKLKTIGGYGRCGSSDLFVYEACEFRDTFLQTYPDMAVVLNIDNDHMDYFGTVENAMKSYTQFCDKAKTVFYDGDDPRTAAAVERSAAPEKITFGRNPSDTYHAANVRRENGLCRHFDLMRSGEKVTEITLHLPGDHNVINATAAAAAALTLGVSPEDVTKYTATFTGAGRRFEVLGRVNGAVIADDYAHHPAELTATLTAAKELGFQRVWAVFQPFTFSRTYMLMSDFVKALSIADKVVLSPIMGSREVNTYGVKASDLGSQIPGCVCLDSFVDIAAYVVQNVHEGDLVITLGCGDIYKCAKMMLLSGQKAQPAGQEC